MKKTILLLLVFCYACHGEKKDCKVLTKQIEEKKITETEAVSSNEIQIQTTPTTQNQIIFDVDEEGDFLPIRIYPNSITKKGEALSRNSYTILGGGVLVALFIAIICNMTLVMHNIFVSMKK